MHTNTCTHERTDKHNRAHTKALKQTEMKTNCLKPFYARFALTELKYRASKWKLCIISVFFVRMVWFQASTECLSAVEHDIPCNLLSFVIQPGLKKKQKPSSDRQLHNKWVSYSL